MTPLMTVADVAKHLGVCPETVRRAIRTGRMPCYRIQGAIRISGEQVTAYLESCMVPVTAAPPAAPLIEHAAEAFSRHRRLRAAVRRAT